MKRFNQYALRAMEKLDSRDTYLKSLGYEYARRVFVISFKQLMVIALTITKEWEKNNGK